MLNLFSELSETLRPYHEVITIMLVVFVCIIVYVLLRNKPVEEATLLALLII